jgi:integrase/recombinase XerD
MKTDVGILFWIRANRENGKGLSTLSCRLTVRSARAEISTNMQVMPKEWSSERQRVLGTSEAAKRTNSYLLQMQNEIENLIADLDRQGKAVTAQGLTRQLRKGSTPTMNLLALCQEFQGERRGLVGVEIAEKTLVINQTRCNRVEDFLTIYGLKQILAEEMTHSMADRLLYWLLKERNFTRSSANKVVQFVFQVLRWSVRREHIERNPLELYRFKSQAKGKIKFLSVGELEAISSIELEENGLGIARDCFVLQCWTGLGYADLAALNVKRDVEYHKDKSGNVRRVLRVIRAKSTMQKGYECVIPLLPEAERLLAHYEDTIPVLTNQAYNRLLKELGELCGIDAEKMTSHVGRKTAGTLLLNMGIPLPVVSKFLGHANTLITQRLYAELLDTTVVDAFAMLSGSALPAYESTTPRVYELPAPSPEPRRAARQIISTACEVQSGSVVPIWVKPITRREVACG